MRSLLTAKTVALGCAYESAMATLTNPTFPVVFSFFLLPVATEFGWGRATASEGLIVSTIAGAIALPIGGRAVDRWGVRAVLFPGMILFSLATMAMSLLNGSIVQLYLLYAVLGFAGAFNAIITYAKLISAWFHKSRGFLLGVALGGGSGIGGVLAPWLAGYLIDHRGWREAYVGLGLVLLICGLPGVLLLSEPPHVHLQRMGAAQARTTSSQLLGKSASEALRTSVFWLIFIAQFLVANSTGGSIAHALPILQDRGFLENVAKYALTAFPIAMTIGHVTTGYLMDRFQTPRVGLPMYVSVLFGLLLLHHGPGMSVVFGPFLMGFGIGSEIGLIAYYTARYFGIRSYAEIYGYMFACANLALSIGPFVMGKLYDLSHTYRFALALFEVTVAASALLILLLPRYTYDVSPPGFQSSSSRDSTLATES